MTLFDWADKHAIAFPIIETATAALIRARDEFILDRLTELASTLPDEGVTVDMARGDCFCIAVHGKPVTPWWRCYVDQDGDSVFLRIEEASK